MGDVNKEGATIAVAAVGVSTAGSTMTGRPAGTIVGVVTAGTSREVMPTLE